MKKILVALLCGVSSLPTYSQTAFTPGNLVVLRAGDGSNTDGVPVSLVEYGRNGALVNTINIPSTGSTKLVLANTTSANQDGGLTLSPDKAYLTVAGYNAAVGTTGVVGAAASTVKRSVALVNAAGSVSMKDIATYGGTSVRSVITTDGDALWFVGGSGGLRYISFAAPTTHTVITSAPALGKFTGIFNNKLYYTSTTAGSVGLNVVSGDLPTTASTASLLSLPGAGTNPNGFMLFDTNADNVLDLLYLADEVVGLQKYSFDGSSWTARGTVVPTGSASTTLRGLTGFYNATNGYILYGNTGSSIVSFTDNTSATTIMNPVVSVLANAEDGYIFRGISFSPGTTQQVLPVKFTSFSGKVMTTHVQLNWSTGLENNNSHFEVLRSADGKAFNVLGTVKGNGTSGTNKNYNFLDYEFIGGLNYYQLNQVDYNGVSAKSAIVKVDVKLSSKDLNLLYSNGKLHLAINSADTENGVINVSNMAGQKIYESEILVQKGSNTLEVPLSNLVAGVYIAKLRVGTKTSMLKFIN